MNYFTGAFFIFSCFLFGAWSRKWPYAVMNLAFYAMGFFLGLAGLLLLGVRVFMLPHLFTVSAIMLLGYICSIWVDILVRRHHEAMLSQFAALVDHAVLHPDSRPARVAVPGQ